MTHKIDIPPNPSNGRICHYEECKLNDRNSRTYSIYKIVYTVIALLTISNVVESAINVTSILLFVAPMIADDLYEFQVLFRSKEEVVRRLYKLQFLINIIMAVLVITLFIGTVVDNGAAFGLNKDFAFYVGVQIPKNIVLIALYANTIFYAVVNMWTPKKSDNLVIKSVVEEGTA